MPSNEFGDIGKIRIIRLEKVDPAELIHLYNHVGWWESENREDHHQIHQLLEGSLCCFGAMDSGRLVGFGRAISDGSSDAYIQDVMVLESHRKMGIGSRIVAKILDEIRALGISWIGLIAAPDTLDFYRGLGFSPMANHTPMRFSGASNHED